MEEDGLDILTVTWLTRFLYISLLFLSNNHSPPAHRSAGPDNGPHTPPLTNVNSIQTYVPSVPSRPPPIPCEPNGPPRFWRKPRFVTSRPQTRNKHPSNFFRDFFATDPSPWQAQSGLPH